MPARQHPPKRPQRHGTSNLNLILGAIALALNQHGLGVMRDPIKQRRSQHRIIVKNARPMLINPVGGDQSRPSLITMADDLKQAISAKLIDGQITQLINAQHLRFHIMGQPGGLGCFDAHGN